MHDREESDSPVVPTKPSNNATVVAAEVVEGRGLAKGNTASKTRPGHSAGLSAPSALDRVRRVAQQDKDARFTALLHYASLDRLRAAYEALSPRAAAGVDGVTWRAYGQDLEASLQDLHRRVQQGAFRAKPSRRSYISKADGRLRPLGIAALEDKIVQRAVVEVLNSVYEADFLGFSYGFRPGRSPHHALDALAAGILKKRVNWVLDADFRKAPDNRHEEGNEGVLHRRSSESRWPRPCVGDPRGRSEALDRGARRPAIEPRNKVLS
jgi:RNA-directed DNA polymerase